MLERFTQRGLGSLYRRAESLRFALGRDRRELAAFVRASRGAADVRRRLHLLWQFERITNAVRGYHTLGEMLRISGHILARPGACVVEAGAAKGSSTAKLSLVVREVGGHLHVFDSFRGLPENDERHLNLDGRPVRFRPGAFTGRLRSVQRTLARYGALEVCTFHKGWFADTMPGFRARVDVAVFDVDLLSSTRSCLEHIVPQLAPTGIAFSQDGHLRDIVSLVSDRDFWTTQVGIRAPKLTGAGTRKLIELRRS